MKVKENLSIDILLDYGFEKINKEIEEQNDEYTLSSFDYKFEIGHARRGQFYYLLVNESTRNIMIYASEPDGMGGIIGCPDILIKLIMDDLVINQ